MEEDDKLEGGQSLGGPIANICTCIKKPSQPESIQNSFDKPTLQCHSKYVNFTFFFKFLCNAGKWLAFMLLSGLVVT